MKTCVKNLNKKFKKMAKCWLIKNLRNIYKIHKKFLNFYKYKEKFKKLILFFKSMLKKTNT